MSPFTETIYGLKREYGKSVTFSFNGKATIDLKTGVTTYPDRVNLIVKQVVVIPAKIGINILRQLVLNQTPHQVGGLQTADYVLLVEECDLKTNKLSIDFIVTISTKKYVITEFVQLDGAYAIGVQITQGGL